MLRPATPLAVLLLAAFGLLLISVLSTPIIRVIPLGSWKDATFGVFGFCDSKGCTPIEIGYDVREYWPTTTRRVMYCIAERDWADT